MIHAASTEVTYFATLSVEIFYLPVASGDAGAITVTYDSAGTDQRGLIAATIEGATALRTTRLFTDGAVAQEGRTGPNLATGRLATQGASVLLSAITVFGRGIPEAAGEGHVLDAHPTQPEIEFHEVKFQGGHRSAPNPASTSLGFRNTNPRGFMDYAMAVASFSAVPEPAFGAGLAAGSLLIGIAARREGPRPRRARARDAETRRARATCRRTRAPSKHDGACGLLGKTEHPLRDDVLLDLVRTAPDRVGARRQPLAGAVELVVLEAYAFPAETLRPQGVDRDVLFALDHVGPAELADRGHVPLELTRAPRLGDPTHRDAERALVDLLRGEALPDRRVGEHAVLDAPPRASRDRPASPGAAPPTPPSAEPSVPRSCWSSRLATVHPPFRGPTTCLAWARASLKKTGEKCAVPSISMSGATSTPGWSIGKRMKEMPSCLGASVSVRTRQKIQSARWAPVVQIF